VDLLNTAYHEAGHALMAVLEYEGQNIPDYISVLPGASGFAGVTMQSLGFLAKMDASDKTYLNFKRDIRVSLGGRAGEEILVGPERITNGASSDLASATNSAKRAFQYWGFCSAMDTPGKSEANLCVISDPPTSSELQHIEKMVRDFLAQEYKIVRDKLIANKSLLDEVANHLMRDNVVDQDELAEICKKYGISIFKH
jgi:ATP-dependent Zn protease